MSIEQLINFNPKVKISQTFFDFDFDFLNCFDVVFFFSMVNFFFFKNVTFFQLFPFFTNKIAKEKKN
jgi:hypothetical protein